MDDLQRRLYKAFKEFHLAWGRLDSIIRETENVEASGIFQQYFWPSLAGIARLRRMYDVPAFQIPWEEE